MTTIPDSVLWRKTHFDEDGRGIFDSLLVTLNISSYGTCFPKRVPVSNAAQNWTPIVSDAEYFHPMNYTRLSVKVAVIAA